MVGSGSCFQGKSLLAFRIDRPLWPLIGGMTDRQAVLPEHSGNPSPNDMKYTASISTRLHFIGPVAFPRHGSCLSTARSYVPWFITPTSGTIQLICGLPSFCHCHFRYFVTLWLFNLPSRRLWCYLGHHPFHSEAEFALVSFSVLFYTNAFLRCHIFALITPLPHFTSLTHSNTVASTKHKWPYFLSSKETRQTPWSHCPRTMTIRQVVGPARFIVIFDRSDWPQ